MCVHALPKDWRLPGLTLYTLLAICAAGFVIFALIVASLQIFAFLLSSVTFHTLPKIRSDRALTLDYSGPNRELRMFSISSSAFSGWVS